MQRDLILSVLLCSAVLLPAPSLARVDDLDRALQGAAERFCQMKCDGGCVDLSVQQSLLDDRWNPWHSASDEELERAVSEGDQQAILWAALKLARSKDAEAKRQAFEQVEAMHEAGLREATAVLGSLYFGGTGVPKDERKARQLFVSALDRGMGWAASPVAMIDWAAARGPADIEGVMRYFAIAADAGSLPAMNNLAILLVRGPEELRDHTRALNLLRRAAEAGSVQAAASLALALYETGDPSALDEAMHWGESAYCRGSNLVGPTLGAIYDARGRTDDARAIALAWAEKGHAMGFRMVFRSMFRSGDARKSGIAIAAARRAYDLSQDDADLHNKGLALVRLGSTDEEVAEGLEAWKLAAGRGYAKSARLLAGFYRGPRDPGPNREEFERWRARAIALGDREAAKMTFGPKP